MSYLLDINIISETVKPKPNLQLIEWLKQVPSESLYLSALSIGEIRKGIELLTASKKKEALTLWLEKDLTLMFDGRIAKVDTRVAEIWGQLSARHHTPVIDGLIAATAMANNFKLVTLNIRDFKSISGLSIMSLDFN